MSSTRSALSPASLLLLLLVALWSSSAVVLCADASALRSLAEHTGSGSSHAEAGAKTESHEAHVEGPTTTSFTGPLIAGALAIVLIGAVVKFRTRAAATN